jgi:hypothetical protein
MTDAKSVRIGDLNFAITRPKDGVVAERAQPKQINYNANGESDIKRKNKFTDSETCALEITVGRQKIYKVKSKRGGAFFNPLRVSFDYGLDKVDKVKNQPMFKFREVNEVAFKNYVRFLDKRHDTLLKTAEREA